MKFTVLNPAGMLARALKEFAAFRNIFMTVYTHSPPTMADPWGLVLYWDEVSPTDPLVNGRDGREVQAVYFTLKQFGNLLPRDDSGSFSPREGLPASTSAKAECRSSQRNWSSASSATWTLGVGSHST